MAKPSNDFKAAAERKKRMNESRKTQRFIGELEELLNVPSNKLSEEDIASARASLDKLKEISAETSAEVDAIMIANEVAQKVLDQISEKLNVAEEPASAEETAPVQVPVEEETKSVPESPETTAEAAGEEVAEVPEVPEAEELTEEEKEKRALSELLHDLYASPRYSRLKGETKTRFSALIKPTLIKKMRTDQEDGKITSPNDLINGLLEIYYGEY